jgi:hypothetical protein
VSPVIIECPNLEKARCWYNSEEYRELKELRLSSAKSDAVFIEGRWATTAADNQVVPVKQCGLTGRDGKQTQLRLSNNRRWTVTSPLPGAS